MLYIYVDIYIYTYFYKNFVYMISYISYSPVVASDAHFNVGWKVADGKLMMILGETHHPRSSFLFFFEFAHENGSLEVRELPC